MKARTVYYRAAEILSRVAPKSLLRPAVRAAACLYARTGSRDLEAIKKNMRHALGAGAAECDVRSAARQLIANYSGYLVDLLYSHELGNASKDLFRVKGLERLDAALERKKGALIVSAHLGNWEMGAMALARRGYDVTALALKHRNPGIDTVFTRRRAANHLHVLHLDGRPLRGAYRALHANRIIAMNADRLFTPEGAAVRFFGRDVFFPKGMEKLSLATGAPVLPTFCLLAPDGIFDVEIQEPLTAGGEGALTQAFARRVEEAVRRYPTQWYLFQPFWEKPEWPA